MLFSVLRSQINRDSSKYEKIVEKRKQSGKMGGLAKAKQIVANVANAKDAKQTVANPSKRKQTVANVADNDNVTVTDTVTDINIIPPIPPLGGECESDEKKRNGLYLRQQKKFSYIALNEAME